MHTSRSWLGAAALLAILAPATWAQNASLTGSVRDPQNAVVGGAKVTLKNVDTGVAQSAVTDDTGAFEFSVVRPGDYALRVEQPGFRAWERAGIVLAVDQRARVDAALEIGDATTVVTVSSEAAGVQTESTTLGEVIETKKIVEIPLNGRFFLDLALLTPGTVVPSTNNRTFLAAPSGIGASGINASGAREDSTNYLFDGINLSDMVQNQITFQPNVDMIQEFKVQTNSFSAEYGRNAGIIVNAVSKSGSNGVHGTAYEFVRNDKFDAKNYFDRGDAPIPPFKRNIFGYSVGGPIVRNRTFFFHSYEGRRGRESVSLRTPVPSDAQRAAVTNPVIRRVLDLVPAANSPGNFFVGSAPKKRTLNQFSGRINHSFNASNLLSGTFISNRDERTEPNLQGGNLPGAGDTRPAKRYFLSLAYTRILRSNLTNELRAGLNRVRIAFLQDAMQDPATFGMRTGSAVPPRFLVSGGMAFGGIPGFPQGRGDTTFQYTDTLSWFRGRHSFKFGGEARRFRNNNFNGGTGGSINFATLADFLNGVASATTQQTLAANPALRVSAINVFAQDDFKIHPRVTLNLGLRYEYNGIPRETHNRLSNFDFGTRQLVALGTTAGAERPYSREHAAFGPRAGIAWDPLGKGKTVVRAGAGLYYDQPVTNLVSALGSNAPFVGSVTFVNSPQRPLNIDLTSPYSLPGGGPTVLNANALDPDLRAGRVLQYNFNVQQDALGTVFQAGYVGSQGRRLRLLRDVNQGINSLRPLPAWGTINLNESSSRSGYNALWLSANRRFSRGLTFTTSYTFSKSIDLNSVGSSNPQIQDAYNLAAERALSDFDARHRYVASLVYLLPWRGRGAWSRLVEGWSVAPIVNLQSGNPFSPIVTLLNSGSLEPFDRPNYVAGQSLLATNPTATQWINKAAFLANQRGQFGNAGRNILKSPGFESVDCSIAKNTTVRENWSLQFRAEAFNLFNHPNLGQPVNVVNNAQFGSINATRTVRGDLGSSRQIQLGLKLIF